MREGREGLGSSRLVDITCRHSKSKTDDILLVQNSSRPRPVGLRYFFFWNDRQLIYILLRDTPVPLIRV